MDDTKNKNVGFGKLVNNPIFFYYDLPVFKLIDLSWASSRLEGNTYSLLETERLIAFGEAAAGKTPFETQMVLNHKAAIEFLVDAVDNIGFDRRTILNLNALLSDNLLGNP